MMLNRPPSMVTIPLRQRLDASPAIARRYTVAGGVRSQFTLWRACQGTLPAQLAVLALSAMVTSWVAWAPPPPLSGGAAVAVTAALVPAPLGLVQGLPP